MAEDFVISGGRLGAVSKHEPQIIVRIYPSTRPESESQHGLPV